jgi:hypothetical protein
LLRLLIATVFMGSVVWMFYPATLHPATYRWLFLSGLIGFGAVPPSVISLLTGMARE